MTPTLSLTEPRADLEESYESYRRELTELDELVVPSVLNTEYDTFEQLLTKLSDAVRGIGVPEGYVPASAFWLVRDDREIVGASHLRHSLTRAE